MTVFVKNFTRARTAFVLSLCLALSMASVARGSPDDEADLLDLSFEDLMQIVVTSVSKRAQKLSEAPAAVTVLTSEDIRRSGMTTIPDLLRTVPANSPGTPPGGPES